MGQKNFEELWYETFYSILFVPPGQVPQKQGTWTEPERVVEALGWMRKQYPAKTMMMVVTSRCGEVWPEDAGQWLAMHEAFKAAAADREAYLKAGVCSGCGACSLEEAEKKCKPQPIGDTGDYGCAGEGLWDQGK